MNSHSLPKLRRTFRFLVFFTMGLICPEYSNSAQPPTANKEETNQGKCCLVTGKELTGELLEWNWEGLTLKTSQSVYHGNSEELVCLTLPGHKPTKKKAIPVKRTLSLVTLANGDRIKGKVVSINEEHLTFQLALPNQETVLFPLETLATILFASENSRQMQNGFSAQSQLSPSRKGEDSFDLLTLQNGDVLQGEFISLSQKSIRWETPQGERELPRSEIHGLKFNEELVSFPRVEGLQLRVHLVDGSFITIQSAVRKVGTVLDCQANCGSRFSIPFSLIYHLEYLHQHLTFLSDLKPELVEHFPYLSRKRFLERDRNGAKGPLSIRGRSYVKGLGMYSKMRAVYNLNSRYQTFMTDLGIDDYSGGEGSVHFVIRLDGEVAYRSPLVTGMSKRISIPSMNVESIQKLELEVDFGERGDLRDYANWCNPILIRKKNSAK